MKKLQDSLLLVLVGLIHSTSTYNLTIVPSQFAFLQKPCVVLTLLNGHCVISKKFNFKKFYLFLISQICDQSCISKPRDVVSGNCGQCPAGDDYMYGWVGSVCQHPTSLLGIVVHESTVIMEWSFTRETS